MYLRSRNPEQDDAHLIAIAANTFGEKVAYSVKKRLEQASEVLVGCDEENQIIGFLIYRLENELAFVDYVVVDTQYRGKGLAHSFMPTVIEYLKSKGARTLSGIVHKRNTDSLNIFLHWGFRIKRDLLLTYVVEKVI